VGRHVRKLSVAFPLVPSPGICLLINLIPVQYACPATLTTEIAICPVVSGQAKSVKASIYTMLAVLNNDTIVAWGELDAFLLDNSPIFAGSYATSPIIANGHEVSQGGIYELHQAFANSMWSPTVRTSHTIGPKRVLTRL
jgi:hypothetical protein